MNFKYHDQKTIFDNLQSLDRLDCLRRIHKGKADFGVFTAEDLVAAANSEIDVLLTNELRFSSGNRTAVNHRVLVLNRFFSKQLDQKFEYELVAVVANAANIRQKHDLRGKRYCHPGYGYEADWTRILSNVCIKYLVIFKVYYQLYCVHIKCSRRYLNLFNTAINVLAVVFLDLTNAFDNLKHLRIFERYFPSRGRRIEAHVITLLCMLC